MKNLLFLGLLAATAAFTSCKKEGCTDQAASNFSSEADIDDGSCTYPAPDPRDAYVGSYWVTDSLWLAGSFNEVQIYALSVTTGGTVSDTIYLNNLWNDGSNYIAVMAGGNFSIPSQQVSGPYYASGNGNFQNDTITYQTSGDVYVNKGSGPK
ncbi:MAG: hypothetical protein ACJAUD_001291 [Crocinitomicaceae bacterium]|jgi:hypothetical protein